MRHGLHRVSPLSKMTSPFHPDSRIPRVADGKSGDSIVVSHRSRRPNGQVVLQKLSAIGKALRLRDDLANPHAQ